MTASAAPTTKSPSCIVESFQEEFSAARESDLFTYGTDTYDAMQMAFHARCRDLIETSKDDNCVESRRRTTAEPGVSPANISAI